MEELRKHLKKVRNAGALLLSAGALLLLTGYFMFRERGEPETAFLSLLGVFMFLLGMGILYHAIKATRLLKKIGGKTGTPTY